MKSTEEIARIVGCKPESVDLWRSRFSILGDGADAINKLKTVMALKQIAVTDDASIAESLRGLDNLIRKVNLRQRWQVWVATTGRNGNDETAVGIWLWPYGMAFDGSKYPHIATYSTFRLYGDGLDVQ